MLDDKDWRVVIQTEQRAGHHLDRDKGVAGSNPATLSFLRIWEVRNSNLFGTIEPSEYKQIKTAMQNEKICMAVPYLPAECGRRLGWVAAIT